MMAGELILIVDDERDLAGTLAYNLERGGYRTREAWDGQQAIEEARRDPMPDLVLLDLMLPTMSGTEVCRRLRQDERTRRLPIIMVTARGEELDRVMGFEVGADDYVTKPYSVKELTLRMKALLRRARGTSENEELGGTRIEFDDLVIETTGPGVMVGGEEVILTALEFKLLATFLMRKGRVQSREVLLRDVWGTHINVQSRTVDTHVKRLREKLGRSGRYIETRRGVGYRFCAHPGEADEELLAGDEELLASDEES